MQTPSWVGAHARRQLDAATSVLVPEAVMGKTTPKKSHQFLIGTSWCPKWHLRAVRAKHASNF